ncbi:OprO/OprP family phosphate-selective porin [Pyxidicoccus xibeiensis]|uniref:OprO/OprP family phosphate-selective porin n=1 Tax=Pyxidicoccus xibeiensis TaxID=2906759 RepID=UPI0020A80165|nr:OprO/OprP family phosphate-selective porin [Pyxidicoccus xibeiensis]MCP3144819.1 OprO/OprP family phosphate-selective porin [Pyxidicoccus xibeiensis]
MRNLLVALFTLTSSVALAQAAEPQPGTGDATTPSTTETSSTETSTTAAAEPSLDERITTAEGKIASFEEQNIETKNDLSSLKKLKFSGYVQGRYQYQEADETGEDIRLTDSFSRFSVRRGRIKATYTADYAQYVLQIDAVPDGVTLKDAEATFFIPGTKQAMSLTLGATKWGFGYEVPQSSSDREFPERTRVVRAFLPGERDLGLKFNGKFGVLRVTAGLFNGASSATPLDADKEKDVIGRIGFDLKWLSGGVSGWYGGAMARRTTGAEPDTYRRYYDRYRVGADLQAYFDVIPLGGTAIKAEYIAGKTYGGATNATNVDVPASGWYALLVQNLGLSNAVAVRYDYFDPANGTKARAASNGIRPASTNAVGTLGVALLHYFGENLKLTAAYELPMTATVEDVDAVEDPADNLFTLQLQARF